jgi:hypothetical protein
MIFRIPLSFMSGRDGVRAGEGPKDSENVKLMSFLEKGGDVG